MSLNGGVAKENSFVKNRAKLFDGANSRQEIELTSTDRQAPSYVTLSCTVNGYSGYTCYDSKTRQNIRSRDSSRDCLPLCLSRSRDPSPRKSTLSSGFQISLSNGVPATPASKTLPSRSKSVDRSLLRQNFLNSSIDNSSLSPKTNWHKSTDNLHQPNLANNTPKEPERGRGRYRATTAPAGDNQENKSLIQQRIERLYGPGALAQSFFTPKAPKKRTPESNNNEEVSEVDFQASLSTPPVFRHLNPEFRQQICSPKNVLAQKQTLPSPTAAVSPTNQDKLPGNIFLKVLEEEKKKFEFRIRVAEEDLKHESVTSSEELTGKIHAANGKCRLLMAQKFEQFAGLCRKNLNQRPDEPFPTTADDLAGFWDMVMIQVEHIYSLFGEIERLKENGWKEVEVKVESSVASKTKRPPSKNLKNAGSSAGRSAKAQEAAKAREEARKKMMEEKRRLMKEKKQTQDENDQSWIVDGRGMNGDVTSKLDGSETLCA